MQQATLSRSVREPADTAVVMPVAIAPALAHQAGKMGQDRGSAVVSKSQPKMPADR